MSKDTADITAVTYVCPGDVRADADNVTGSPDAEPSISTQGNVAATGGVAGECTNTDRRVEVAGRVAEEYTTAVSCVRVATAKKEVAGVAKESERAGGRVAVAYGVVKKGECSICRVVTPSSVT